MLAFNIGPQELMLLTCPALVIAVVIVVLFLLSMQRALNAVSPMNRQMEPAMVWLMLLPCVNIVWQFLLVIRIPDSLRAEYRARGLDEDGDFGKTLGLCYCIVGMLGGISGRVLSLSAETQSLGLAIIGMTLVLQIVLGISFWSKISSYSKELQTMRSIEGPGGYRGAVDGNLGDYNAPFRPGEFHSQQGPQDAIRPEEPGSHGDLSPGADEPRQSL
jgi:hypothetical protein